jgi:hypothetical protein
MGLVHRIAQLVHPPPVHLLTPHGVGSPLLTPHGVGSPPDPSWGWFTGDARAVKVGADHLLTPHGVGSLAAARAAKENDELLTPHEVGSHGPPGPTTDLCHVHPRRSGRWQVRRSSPDPSWGWFTARIAMDGVGGVRLLTPHGVGSPRATGPSVRHAGQRGLRQTEGKRDLS